MSMKYLSNINFKKKMEISIFESIFIFNYLDTN